MPGLNDATRARVPELACEFRASVGDYACCLVLSSDDAMLAVGSADGVVSVLDARTGERTYAHPSHRGGTLTLAFSPTGRALASGGQDGTLALHDGSLPPSVLLSGRPWVDHVTFSPDGLHVACAAGRTVSLFRTTGELVAELADHPSTVTGLAFDPSGTLLYAGAYGGVAVWSLERRERARTFLFGGSLVSLALCPAGRVLACSTQEGTVHFWRTRTGADAEMSGYLQKPKVLCWDAKGSLLATSGSPAVTVWSFSGKGPEGTRPILLEGHLGFVQALAFAAHDGVLASGGDEGSVFVWRPRAQRSPRGGAQLDETVTALAFARSAPRLFGADALGNVAAFRLARL